MALAVLSPWPSTPAALTAARACLSEGLDGGITDDRVDALGAAAAALVERYAAGAPQSIKNEAVIRCAGYLADMPAASLTMSTVGPMTLQLAPARQSALRHSGAMALLSPWKVRRAGAIG